MWGGSSLCRGIQGTNGNSDNMEIEIDTRIAFRD